MLCARCQAAAAVLKTARWRDRRSGPFALCDPCWLPIAGAVLVVPGRVTAFGTCRSCGEWVSVRELSDAKPGGRQSAPSGTCTACARGEGR